MKRKYRNTSERNFSRKPNRTLREHPLFLSLQHISPDARRGIGIVILLTFTLLSFLSLFGLSGSVGVWLSGFMGMLLGKTRALFPITLFIIAIFIQRRQPFHVQGVRLIGLLFFILSFTALWHISYPLEDSFDIARTGGGGGVTGFILSYALQTALGFWGTLLVLIAIMTSSLLIHFNTSFGTFFVTMRNAVSSLKMPRPRREYREAVQDVSGQEGLLEAETEVPEFAKKTFTQEEKNTVPQKDSEASTQMEVLQPPKAKQKIHLSTNLLNNKLYQPTSGDIKTNRVIIQKTLENFGIPVEMGEVHIGPTVTQYTLKPADGVKLASITGLHNDLALSLAAHPIRIEAPIPGKSFVGIEVPNQKVAMVTLREMLESETFKKRKNNLHLALGKDVSGVARLANVATMPHLLIAGSTGSGKTVCINTLITSLLFQNTPDDLRFIMVDPKRVELTSYNDIPHLLTPVITDVKKTINALKWAIGEMDRRFTILAQYGKRDLISFNQTVPDKLPFIIIIIDELADVMATAGPDAENLIIRLAQMARAVGIHLILATQRPSVDVITGLIKANITSRIAFAVASQMDSRTILDTSGAERLIGRGDMLYISSELSKPLRLQGAYVSDDEIERIVACLKESGEPAYEMSVTEKSSGGSSGGSDMGGDDDDDLLPEAKDVILQAQKASASLLQRRLRVGYARAARILDLLEAQGFIGPADGARPRELLASNLDELDMLQGQEDGRDAA